MLVIKQVEAGPGALAYECHADGQLVGRLAAVLRPDGGLAVRLIETTRNEAGRSLVAKLERDALAHDLTEIYLFARDTKEASQFEPAGYQPLEDDKLILLKRLVSGR